MSLVINTNIMSLNAQRNLAASGSDLATSLQRLSSGLRINSAKDDAAGLAISTRMTTQINGLDQAVRNANDGISLAQTTEGALEEMTNNLQRIRELAVQSANASNSDSDRAALDQEVQQRIAEINRSANQTSFNGRKVLDGSFGSATFQIGANVGETIGITLDNTTSMQTAAIGKIATATSYDISDLFSGGNTGVSGAFTVGGTSGATDTVTLTVGGVGITTAALGAGATSSAVAGAIDTAIATTAVQTALATAGITVTGTAAAGTLEFSKAGAAADVTFTGTGGLATTPGSFANTSFVGTHAAGATSLTLGAGQFNIAVGSDAAVDVTGTFASGADLATAISTQTGVAASYNNGVLSLASGSNITLGGTLYSATSGAGKLDFNTTLAKTTTTGPALSSMNVLTADGANETLLSVDNALTSVSNLRSTLGAVQNRFQSTINSLQAVSENLTSSRSRILDTDFAAETANLTRAQILQQAGTAMVAQANSIPQNVLSLLK
ncbi:MAG TPA: flagellin [Steroidobacteraceae bacterium]|nr:flagellin [Steroidobacteraceae bacterium]